MHVVRRKGAMTLEPGRVARLAIPIILGLLLVATAPARVDACEGSGPTLRHAVVHARAVVIATVTAARRADGDATETRDLRVERVLKGAADPVLSAFSDPVHVCGDRIGEAPGTRILLALDVPYYDATLSPYVAFDSNDQVTTPLIELSPEAHDLAAVVAAVEALVPEPTALPPGVHLRGRLATSADERGTLGPFVNAVVHARGGVISIDIPHFSERPQGFRTGVLRLSTRPPSPPGAEPRPGGRVEANERGPVLFRFPLERAEFGAYATFRASPAFQPSPAAPTLEDAITALTSGRAYLEVRAAQADEARTSAVSWCRRRSSRCPRPTPTRGPRPVRRARPSRPCSSCSSWCRSRFARARMPFPLEVRAGRCARVPATARRRSRPALSPG